MNGEGFREEDEGDDNTESFPEGGDSDGKEGTKLTNKAKDNLKNKRNLLFNVQFKLRELREGYKKINGKFH